MDEIHRMVRPRAATLVAGNSRLGVSLPPNSTMFILAATPAAVGVSSGGVYVSLAVAGTYCVLYRLALVWFWTRKDGTPATPSELVVRFGAALRQGWSSTLIFVGIPVPVLLTFGPLSQFLSSPERVGEDAIGSISIIVWVPILISVIALIEGRKRLRARWPENSFSQCAGKYRSSPPWASRCLPRWQLPGSWKNPGWGRSALITFILQYFKRTAGDGEGEG